MKCKSLSVLSKEHFSDDDSRFPLELKNLFGITWWRKTTIFLNLKETKELKEMIFKEKTEAPLSMTQFWMINYKKIDKQNLQENILSL